VERESAAGFKQAPAVGIIPAAASITISMLLEMLLVSRSKFVFRTEDSP
jgi:hypothetical protein